MGKGWSVIFVKQIIKRYKGGVVYFQVWGVFSNNNERFGESLQRKGHIWVWQRWRPNLFDPLVLAKSTWSVWAAGSRPLAGDIVWWNGVTGGEVPASAQRLMVFSIQGRNDQRIIWRGHTWQPVGCKLFESKHLKKIQAQRNSENKLLLQVMMAKMNQKKL